MDVWFYTNLITITNVSYHEQDFKAMETQGVPHFLSPCARYGRRGTNTVLSRRSVCCHCPLFLMLWGCFSLHEKMDVWWESWQPCITYRKKLSGLRVYTGLFLLVSNTPDLVSRTAHRRPGLLVHHYYWYYVVFVECYVFLIWLVQVFREQWVRKLFLFFLH